jgi:hypothetical protein
MVDETPAVEENHTVEEPPACPQQNCCPPIWCQEDLNNASSKSDFQQAAEYPTTGASATTTATITTHEHNIFSLTAISTLQSTDEPHSYKEAMCGIDANNWKQGIKDKLQSIVENNTSE